MSEQGVSSAGNAGSSPQPNASQPTPLEDLQQQLANGFEMQDLSFEAGSGSFHPRTATAPTETKTETTSTDKQTEPAPKLSTDKGKAVVGSSGSTAEGMTKKQTADESENKVENKDKGKDKSENNSNNDQGKGGAKVEAEAENDNNNADSEEGERREGPSEKALGKRPIEQPPSDEEDPSATSPADGKTDEDPSEQSEPAVHLIMMVATTNTRHQLRITEKYLSKHNVQAAGQTEDGKVDPYSITVYTLKELILRNWQNDWGAAPRVPTSIRLIFFGKMLADRQNLGHYRFNKTGSNVLHMTIKPPEVVDEEEANKTKGPASPGNQVGSRGCCVIL